MNNPLKREMSEGEELIKEFLEEEAIDFKQEVEIPSLKEDDKLFRKADFYLPQYKVYVEFLGQWNKEEHKSRYIEKIKVYAANNIPCVYLYPDNLGILSFIFKRRLKKVLKKNKELKWQLFKLNWELFTEKVGLTAIILGFLIYYINNLTARILLILLLIYSLYKPFKESFLK
jgi:hypothetical protein